MPSTRPVDSPSTILSANPQSEILNYPILVNGRTPISFTVRMFFIDGQYCTLSSLQPQSGISIDPSGFMLISFQSFAKIASTASLFAFILK